MFQTMETTEDAAPLLSATTSPRSQSEFEHAATLCSPPQRQQFHYQHYPPCRIKPWPAYTRPIDISHSSRRIRR